MWYTYVRIHELNASSMLPPWWNKSEDLHINPKRQPIFFERNTCADIRENSCSEKKAKFTGNACHVVLLSNKVVNICLQIINYLKTIASGSYEFSRKAFHRTSADDCLILPCHTSSLYENLATKILAYSLNYGLPPYFVWKLSKLIRFYSSWKPILLD